MKVPIAGQRCQVHSLPLPQPTRGLAQPVKPGDPALKISDAVSCNACHGPSGTWNGLHDKQADADESWSNQQQKALGGHDQLLKKYGFYNTRPLIERASAA